VTLGAAARARRGSVARAVAGIAIVGGAAAATVVLAVVSDGNPILVLAPVIGLAALWLIAVLPIRYTLLAVTFLCLSLDKPGDSNGVWSSPLAPLGGLLLLNLNKTINVTALTFSVLQMLLAGLLVLRLFRWALKIPVGERDGVWAGPPMLISLLISLAAVAIVTVFGIARGGDGQMAKIQLQVFLPLLALAYLLGVSLRGTKDYKALAIVVVASACVKALMALWLRMTLPVQFGSGRGQMEYATTHGDSMHFAVAAAILLALFFEKPIRRHAHLLLLVTPILLAGMWANNRRLVWAQFGVACAILLTMNLRGRATRALIRGAVYMLPVILIYCVVGWNSGSKIFAPVRTIRSMTDSEVDRSTFYRDSENYNLVYTFQSNPFLGTGFGHPFELAVKLDDISSGFREWRYLPHNSILGLWAFAGMIGFTGIFWAPMCGLMLAARSYRLTRSPDERIAASCAMSSIAVYVLHCWGDIGFTEQKSIFLVGAAIAVAGQVAMSSGAWRVRVAERLPVQQAA
jgi:O-Antigen ligase